MVWFFGVFLLDQVAGRVVLVSGLLSHRADLRHQPSVVVVAERGALAFGVGQQRQIPQHVIAVGGGSGGVRHGGQTIQGVVAVTRGLARPALSLSKGRSGLSDFPAAS